MAKTMNVKTALNIDNREALKAVKALANELLALKKTLDDPLALRVKLDSQSVRNLKSELKSALQQVQVSPISSRGGTTTAQTTELRRVAQESQRTSKQIQTDIRRSVSYLQSIGTGSAQAINSAVTSSIGGIDRLVAKAKSAQESLESTFSFYKGGASGFINDIGGMGRGGIGSGNLPAVKEWTEVFSYAKKAMEEYGDVIEGEVIDEFGNLRNVTYDTFTVVDNETDNATKSMKQLGQEVQSVGRSIQSTGRTITKLGDGISQMSVKSMGVIKTVGETALRSLALLGVDTSNIVGNAVDEIKTLEQAQVGLRNQLSYKETGFDIDSYIDQIKQEAKKTVGVSAGSLADYIMQVAPAASSSDQAFEATMGLLKSIAFSGGDTSTELGYVVRNIRDVLAKGKAYQMDINQFNRAIPGLPTILQQAGLTQYVSDGQLNITEENVGQLLDVFAQLNKEGSPVAGILEEMNQTLSGLLEESEETIQQTVVAAIEESGLLEVWKDLLRNENIQTFVDEVARGLAGGLADFLSSFDMDTVLTEFFNVIREVSQYAKDTILPALKEALGLSKDADLTDTIVKLTQLLGDVAKGMVDGIKWTLDVISTLRKFNEWLKSVGINTADLVKVAGWLVTAGWGLGKIISTFGVSMTNLGRIVDYVGRKLKTMGDQTATSGSTSIAGGVGDRLAQTISGITGRSITSSTLLTSASALIGGHMASGALASAIGGDNSTAKGIIKDVTDLGSTFFAFNKILGPVGGVFAAFIEGLGKVTSAMNSIEQTRKEGRAAAAQQSLDTLQNVYVNNLKDMLRNAGLFSYEDPDSEDALVAAMEEALNIKSGDDPQEALNRLLNVYMQKYSANVTSTKFADYLAAITDPSNQAYIYGPTRLTSAYANTAQGTQALKTTYNRLLELGMVSAGPDIADYTGEELLRYFQNHGYKFESVEQLMAVMNYGESSRTGQQSILDQVSKVNFEVNGTQLQEDVEGYMDELGMYHLPDGGWGIKSEFRFQVSEVANAEVRKEILDTLGLTEIEPGKAVLEVGVMPTAYDSEKRSSALSNANLYKALTGEDLPAPVKRNFAGGYITPIYRAGGGDVPIMGVDVVPAMLARGEFVQPDHAVKTAGLSTMEALRRGDLVSAYNLIGSRIGGSAHNYTNTSNSWRQNSQSNMIVVNYANQSARRGAYRSIANMMAMR